MNSKLRDIVVLVALTLALVWCIPAMGQVLKGSISGTVIDPQNAVVSGATVKATQIDTGAVYTTTSDSSGLFRFNLIPSGSYKVEISSQGFKTAVENNIPVVAGADRNVGTVKLAVGETNTTVEVAAAAPLIDTNQSQVTNTFSGVQLQTFTGIQENEGLDNLALFVPGISNTRDQTFSNTNGVGFSVNGLRGRNNDQEIDGQNNNDNSVGGPGLFVSDTEFVSQYILVTNQFGPEYGRNAGSVVNIITKSGTNAWHGSLFGYENNSILNTLNNQQKRFEGLTELPRLNNEFGGFTIGGPMVKNKMFIFGGFDEQIVSQSSVFSSTNLTPTPAGISQLNGCFPASTGLAAFNKFGPYAISAGNPHPLAGTDTTLNVGSCANVPFAGIERTLSTPFHGFDFILRNDIQLGGDTLTSRYIFNRGNNFNLDPGGDGAVLGYPINITALSQAILESWTHNFGAHMVNEARVAFGRLNVDFGGNNIGNTVPVAGNLQSALAQATIGPAPGFLELFGSPNNIPQSRIVNTWQAQDNWNYVLGKHQLKAGVNWSYQRSPNIFLPNINGTYRYSSWNSVVNNTPNRVRVANGTPSLDFREYDTFVYGGDDWKISQSLTLNLGLTWTYYGQPENLFNELSTKQQTSSTPFWNPALPLSITTSPIIPAVKNSFGPSVGFAYSPQWGGFLTGHGKTTFRGGFRMLYDPPYYNIYINESSSAPNVFLQSFTGSKASTKPMPSVPTGPNVRSSLSAFLTPGVLDPRTQNQTNVTPNFGPDKVNAWSFGLEREITKNSAFEARYAGNRAYDLFQTFNGNPFIADLAAAFPQFTTGLTPCPATQQVGPGSGSDVGRVHCGTGNLRSRGNGGFSYYNGVQLEFRTTNLFKQLTLKTAYTWSKTLDNVSEIFATGGGGNTTPISQNPLNAGLPEKSFSGLDYPNAWSLIFTEQLPFFKEQHGFMGHLLGGWSFSGSYLLVSGQRYTPSQVELATLTGGDFYDLNFWANFIGFEPARPFLGNLHAPATSVGAFAGDACAFFSFTGTDPLCTGNPNQLINLSAVGKSGCESDPTIPCPFVPVTKDQVRFIANTGIAQTVFGTPFGNTPRNIVQDAISNIGNFSVYKSLKLGERAHFEFRTSFLNVFNHPNFSSIDPFLEDAGLSGSFTGFGDPTLTGSTPRTILFGGKITF